MKTRPVIMTLMLLASAMGSFAQTQKTVAEIQAAGGVRAVLPNFFYETQFQVLSYDISFSGEGFDDIIVVHNEGAAYDPICKQYIARCRPGTEILIENVRVVGPDKRIRKLKDVLFYILK